MKKIFFTLMLTTLTMFLIFSCTGEDTSFDITGKWVEKEGSFVELSEGWASFVLNSVKTSGPVTGSDLTLIKVGYGFTYRVDESQNTQLLPRNVRMSFKVVSVSKKELILKYLGDEEIIFTLNRQ